MGFFSFGGETPMGAPPDLLLQQFFPMGPQSPMLNQVILFSLSQLYPSIDLKKFSLFNASVFVSNTSK